MRLLPAILLAALASPLVGKVAGSTQEITSKWSELTVDDQDRIPVDQQRRLGPADTTNATEAAGEGGPKPELPVGNETSTENPTSDHGSPTTTETDPPPAQTEDPQGGAEDSPTNDVVPGGEATPPGPPSEPGGEATPPGPPSDNSQGGPQPGGEANVPPPPKEGEGRPPLAGGDRPTAEDVSKPKPSKGSPGPASGSGPSSGKGKKGASKTGPNAEAETVDSNTDCASLQGASVKGQVQYTVEVIAATDKDAAVVADDVNDLVVSSLTKSLVKNDCTRRRLGIRDQRRWRQNQQRRSMAENKFLSISSGGSKASGPCPSGDASCFRVVSTVNFDVVEGEGAVGADKQVIDALSPAFATLSSEQVRFIGASSGEQDRTSVAAAEGSSSQESRKGPGVSSTTIGIVFAALVASVVAVALYVRSQRRRATRLNAELDKVEKELNMTDVTVDDSGLVYVYDDESEGYESDYQLTSRERRFLSKLRLPRRKEKNKKAKSKANEPPHIDATFVDDDQSVEVIERTTLKTPPVPRTYSGTIITPPPESKRARREWFANTVDF